MASSAHSCVACKNSPAAHGLCLNALMLSTEQAHFLSLHKVLLTGDPAETYLSTSLFHWRHCPAVNLPPCARLPSQSAPVTSCTAAPAAKSARWPSSARRLRAHRRLCIMESASPCLPAFLGGKACAWTYLGSAPLPQNLGSSSPSQNLSVRPHSSTSAAWTTSAHAIASPSCLSSSRLPFSHPSKHSIGGACGARAHPVGLRRGNALGALIVHCNNLLLVLRNWRATTL